MPCRIHWQIRWQIHWQRRRRREVYVNDTASTSTIYTDTNTTAGTRRVYRVKATNAAGLSRWSNYVRADPVG